MVKQIPSTVAYQLTGGEEFPLEYIHLKHVWYTSSRKTAHPEANDRDDTQPMPDQYFRTPLGKLMPSSA